jgi:serine/threonine protein kinase
MLLGKGGFASVQLATHAISAEQVAVKRVRNSPVARREVELMRSLPTNAHLLPLIDVFETNGELILALPLCSGGSLQAIADQVRADRALAPSENDILRWFHHTCIAVAALHDRGIAHATSSLPTCFCGAPIVARRCSVTLAVRALRV